MMQRYDKLERALASGDFSAFMGNADKKSLVSMKAKVDADKREALASGDWGRYLIWFDGHTRLKPFTEIESKMNDVDYWRELSGVWQQMDKR